MPSKKQLILSSENVVDFLKEHNLCAADFEPAEEIAARDGTNFNLVVKTQAEYDLLVKQNRLDSQGRGSSSLHAEWVVQSLVNTFNLKMIQPLVSQVLWLDTTNSILVAVFYDRHLALDRYYATHDVFPAPIARVLGSNLARVHRATYQQEPQKEFFARYFPPAESNRLPGFIYRLNNLDPSIFARICEDGLEFYRLYQKFPSLNHAVLELFARVEPSCLIHNDLTLDNFIVDAQLGSNANEIEPEQVKIIDWERSKWGDPAIDLGMVVAEYVGGIWLGNLVVDRHLDLETMLAMATYPLESLVPSLQALLQAYLTQFPEIIRDRPDFIRRVIQFAGIGILDRLSYHVEHHYQFHNNSICKLQVAKNLLCDPAASISSIFGSSEMELSAFAIQTT